MKRPWFHRVGWSHLPQTWEGWVIVLMGTAFLCITFRAVDARSHSVSDTLHGIFPSWASAFLLYDWLAARVAGRAGINPGPRPSQREPQPEDRGGADRRSKA